MPQIGAMYEGDASRKRTLVEHGFRLPSALDNRPLKLGRVPRAASARRSTSRRRPASTRWASPTASSSRSSARPGSIDPQIVVKPTQGADRRPARGDPHPRRDATSACSSRPSPRRWPRSSPTSSARPACACATCTRMSTPCAASSCSPSCAQGVYDVLVGINLLREGLDLPEVSLVAILDADKEGFLRSSTSLIQTIGRAARNVSGEVHMYADVLTDSMKKAIEETDRRREKQVAYNTRARHRPAAAAQEDRRHHRRARSRGCRHRRAAGRAATARSGRRRRTCAARASPPRARTSSSRSSATSTSRCSGRGRAEVRARGRLRDEVSDLKKDCADGGRGPSALIIASGIRSSGVHDMQETCPRSSIPTYRSATGHLRPGVG